VRQQLVVGAVEHDQQRRRADDQLLVHAERSVIDRCGDVDGSRRRSTGVDVHLAQRCGRRGEASPRCSVGHRGAMLATAWRIGGARQGGG
jgi:hypothetical protein